MKLEDVEIAILRWTCGVLKPRTLAFLILQLTGLIALGVLYLIAEMVR